MQFSDELVESLKNLNGVEKLRESTRAWLATQNVSQKTLSQLLGVSEVFLSQFLTGEKTVSAKNYVKLSYLIGQQVCLGSRIVNAQSFGQPVKGSTIDKGAVHEQFNNEHAEQIIRTHRVRDENTL
jgi:hypothetical protein